MAKKFDYRLIIIGGGPTGTAAALSAVKCCKSPRQVALIAAPNYTKTEIGNIANFAGIAATRALISEAAKHSHSSKIKTGEFSSALWRQQLSDLQKIADQARRSTKNQLLDAGINWLEARARFLNPYEVILEGQTPESGQRLTAARFIIATGAEPNLGSIKIARQLQYLTPDNFYTQTPPKHICIVGAGSSGCALAQYFAALGSTVLLLEQQERLLPNEDVEVSYFLANIFKRYPNIKVFTGIRVLAAAEGNGRKRLLVRYRKQEKILKADALVFATGYQPILSCALDNAQVAYGKNGIRTDRSLQSSSRHIWAAGSCLHANCSPEQAAYEGDLAGSNALGHGRNLYSYAGFGRLVQTSPSIVSLGLNENDCLKQGIRGYHKVVQPISQTQAASVRSHRSGFVKIICDRTGVILGTTVVAPNAEEIAQEIAFTLRHELTCVELASTPHPAFSYCSVVQIAARKLLANLNLTK